jgi:hypothetical protein
MAVNRIGVAAALTLAAVSCSAAPSTVAPSVAATAPTTTATETVPVTAPQLASARWIPPQGVPWQWVLDHPLNLDDPNDMGSKWLTPSGAPARPPTVFDIDGFANEPATVTALHGLAAKAICYIEVGGLEPDRPDGDQFPAAAIGATVDGYPDEHYVDIRSADVLAAVLARVEMCAAKGFDAVEPDLDDTFMEDTGFALTQPDQVAFNAAIATRAHQLGMSIALKNGDESTFTAQMQPLVDFALDEQCFEFETCDAFATFTDAGKAVLEVEYNLPPDQFCPAALNSSFSAVLHDPALAGGGTPCR